MLSKVSTTSKVITLSSNRFPTEDVHSGEAFPIFPLCVSEPSVGFPLLIEFSLCHLLPTVNKIIEAGNSLNSEPKHQMKAQH